MLLASLGVKMPDMLPFYSKVMVKVKRWRRQEAGPLPSPYEAATLLGPSPVMMTAWIVEDETGSVYSTPERIARRARRARRMLTKGPLHPHPRLGDALLVALECLRDPRSVMMSFNPLLPRRSVQCRPLGWNSNL